MTTTYKLCWGAEAEIVMLDFYRDNEQLWNYKHQDYYDRDVRDRTLQELSIKLGHDFNGVPYTVNDIKYKIKNLRATFGRELMKYVVSRRNGRAHRYTPRWRHYHRMMFLRNSRKPRDKNMATEEESCSTDNEDHLDMFCDIEIEEEDVDENEENERLSSNQATAETNQPSDVDESILTQDEERKNNLQAIVLAGSETSLEPIMFPSNDELRGRMTTTLSRTIRSSRSSLTNRRQSTASVEVASTIEPIDNYSSSPPNSSSREDSEYYFCMSLAENLRKMAPYQRELAKIEMQKVMMRFMFPVCS